MPRYLVTSWQREEYEAFVEASSPEEARDKFARGEWEDVWATGRIGHRGRGTVQRVEDEAEKS